MVTILHTIDFVKWQHVYQTFKHIIPFRSRAQWRFWPLNTIASLYTWKSLAYDFDNRHTTTSLSWENLFYNAQVQCESTSTYNYTNPRINWFDMPSHKKFFLRTERRAGTWAGVILKFAFFISSFFRLYENCDLMRQLSLCIMAGKRNFLMGVVFYR